MKIEITLYCPNCQITKIKRSGKKSCKKTRFYNSKKLRDKLISMGISYDVVYTDKWDSFIAVFQKDRHIVGKANTKGIEGNNCRLRHRIRRAY